MDMTEQGVKRLSNSAWLESEPAPLERLVWVVPLATAVAITANVIFYYILTRWLKIELKFPSQTPERTLTPMPVYDVILFSLIFALGAGVVFVLVTQLAQRPLRTYLVIATAVLFLSFVLPLRIPSPPVAMVDKLSLVAMHIIGAIAVVGVLVGLGRKH